MTRYYTLTKPKTTDTGTARHTLLNGASTAGQGFIKADLTPRPTKRCAGAGLWEMH